MRLLCFQEIYCYIPWQQHQLQTRTLSYSRLAPARRPGSILLIWIKLHPKSLLVLLKSRRQQFSLNLAINFSWYLLTLSEFSLSFSLTVCCGNQQAFQRLLNDRQLEIVKCVSPLTINFWELLTARWFAISIWPATRNLGQSEQQTVFWLLNDRQVKKSYHCILNKLELCNFASSSQNCVRVKLVKISKFFFLYIVMKSGSIR